MKNEHADIIKEENILSNTLILWPKKNHSQNMYNYIIYINPNWSFQPIFYVYNE